MAHFAELNEQNIVTRVVVISNKEIIDEYGDESEQLGVEFCKKLYGEQTEWVQTSYNSNFRKRYAGVGYTYDSINDVFIPPQPFRNWVLNSEFEWSPPFPHPEDGLNYVWNDELVMWEVFG